MNPEIEIQKEKERLMRSDIPKEAKDDILDFLNEMRFEGKSFSHQYYYGTRLRIIAGILQDKFCNPSKQDIKWLLNELIERRAKTGMHLEKQRSRSTIEDYKKTIKHYYKWKLGTGEGKLRTEPDCTRWISRNRNLGSKVKPEELIKKSEYEKMLDSCMNGRDRALISTLYDSGCRLGEVLSLRIRDAQSDQYGYVLAVTGKTGFRRVRIVGNSVAYLKEWLDNHPNRNDIDAPIFCGLEMRNYNRAMDHSDVYSMFRKVLGRAEITRRIHPHLFRHSYVTRMVDKNLSESALKDQVGWTKGSRMIEVYEHLSVKQKDEAILRASGITIEQEQEEDMLPITCQRCGKKNPSNAKTCHTCWMPLTVEEAINEIEKEKKVTNALSSIISGDQKALLQNLPEESKLDVLSTLLIDLERKGQLDLIKNRLKEQNHDEQKDEQKDEPKAEEQKEKRSKK
ncbi:MAG: site-specific integrase [Candidatus Thermoplasmatota archaeon]|nr:site-specific integrase [Candidatus Thermoplasmatota archaeon]